MIARSYSCNFVSAFPRLSKANARSRGLRRPDSMRLVQASIAASGGELSSKHIPRSSAAASNAETITRIVANATVWQVRPSQGPIYISKPRLGCHLGACPVWQVDLSKNIVMYDSDLFSARWSIAWDDT